MGADIVSKMTPEELAEFHERVKAKVVELTTKKFFGEADDLREAFLAYKSCEDIGDGSTEAREIAAEERYNEHVQQILAMERFRKNFLQQVKQFRSRQRNGVFFNAKIPNV
jgi:Na+-transporting NADH:ubiquinone oxidoreductase subunit NqrC